MENHDYDKWKTAGYDVPFPHLTHPKNWPAYSLRIMCYTREIGVRELLKEEREWAEFYGSHQELEDMDDFLKVLILSTVSDEIAGCLKDLGHTELSKAYVVWQDLERLMDPEKGTGEKFQEYRKRMQRAVELHAQLQRRPLFNAILVKIAIQHYDKTN